MLHYMLLGGLLAQRSKMLSIFTVFVKPQLVLGFAVFNVHCITSANFKDFQTPHMLM